MSTRFITSVAVFLLGGAFLCSLSAEQTRISMGHEDAWSGISRFEEARLEEGQRGFLDIVMAYRRYDPESVPTDMLLHFETLPIRDHASRYMVTASEKVAILPLGKIGGGAAFFSRESGGLTMDFSGTASGEKGSPLFLPGSVWEDFTIEFWLRPGYLENGEKILRWEGQRLLSGRLQLQTLTCTVEKRLLKWDFENFFLHPGSGEISFSLKGKKALIPDRWNHHMVRFDAQTGLMEYLVNGIPEAVLYITTNGTPSGSVMRPYIGKRSLGRLQIAPAYTGMMDEFRISRIFLTDPQLKKFSRNGGSVEIGPVHLGEEGSEINSIDLEVSTPAGTGVYSYYRLAESPSSLGLDRPEWIPFRPGEEFVPPPKAGYLGIKIELFPDGEGLISPRVSSAAINYRPNLPPPPPVGLTALPKNGKIHLTWSALQQRDLGGYLVYYGESPGVYRGQEASEGASPIDIGTDTELTLSSLENGKIYYFAVAAYDTVGSSHRGPLSQEVSARPSAYYGE